MVQAAELAASSCELSQGNEPENIQNERPQAPALQVLVADLKECTEDLQRIVPGHNPAVVVDDLNTIPSDTSSHYRVNLLGDG